MKVEDHGANAKICIMFMVKVNINKKPGKASFIYKLIIGIVNIVAKTIIK